MKKDKQILETAKRTVQIEADSIQQLIAYLDDTFVQAVKTIIESKGRVVITGIGKSAIIGNKIVATFNSTGTPAIFMHAADAIHGDLGTIQKDDVVIFISKSGNTPEVKVLVPLIKKSTNKIIAITGNTDSYIAQQADIVLNAYVEKEACPNNLAPTSSTTAQLVLGDALAVCLLEQRDFTSKDFARFHPGGVLGKQLYLRVRDLIANNAKPEVGPEATIKDVIYEISAKRMGTSAVVENGRVIGIITDGDIRRMLERNDDIKHLKAKDIMSKNPKWIAPDEMAVDAVKVMKKHDISGILVIDDNKYLGIIHFQDLLKEGLI
ncbi:MAG TPA: KpsF/GutQ family sugar-phosphate isomerase [Draconibacterium sp.]|nr:KpsF/GutQ family sugar-phosphate isomerase [Draconibacterium sp.]